MLNCPALRLHARLRHADADSFETELGGRATCMPADKMFCRDTHAEGAVATPFGPLHVKWRLAESDLRVEVQAPTEVSSAVFKDNPSHVGLKVTYESATAERAS